MKRNTLRIKMYILLISAVAFLSVVAASVSSVFYSKALTKRYTDVCRTVCKTTSGLINVENIEKYLAGNNTVEYVEVSDRIITLKNAITDIEHIAVYKMNSSFMQTVFDTSSTEIKSGLGTTKNYDNTWRVYKNELGKGVLIENARVLMNSGMADMYCMPLAVLNDGSCIYVCAGVSHNLINSEKAAFNSNNRKIILMLAVFIILCAGFILEKKVIGPVKRILVLVDGATERKDIGFIQEIINSKIKTKNELENLYCSLLKIYTLKVRLESVTENADTKNSETVVSLIKRMDKFAESHLDNSLQYIILMLRKLRESGKYDDILTDKMCNDIVLAAPLHDVGKLAVEDEIVNKPSRLTEEEFEKMKEHSVLGAKIIDEMYIRHSEEDYLYMAREIAKSHHERWNGQGYPEKLKGEEIPLYVRIVSIADVFDALLSERVYKEPYTFEKSMEIIASYEGTYFDPELTRIFVEAKDDVYDIYKSIREKTKQGKKRLGGKK